MKIIMSVMIFVSSTLFIKGSKIVSSQLIAACLSYRVLRYGNFLSCQ